MDGFQTTVATRLSQVTYTSSISMASYATNVPSRKRFHPSDRNFVTALVELLEKLINWSAHRTGWSAQSIVAVRDPSASSVGFSTAEKQMRPVILLQHPWARLEVFKSEGKEKLLGRVENIICTLKAAPTQS